ncbi:MAG TPA: outer membrane protein transport protein [Verrucomicrobiae bacterium]|nr:outer membrane protein transport protein [Verrucomicrobiae bacterium]
MNRRNPLKLAVAIILPALALKVSANGLRLASQDGFATARGEAFVATADNPSAIYYNPAGITQVSGSELRSGLYSIYLDPTFQPPSTALNAGQAYGIGKHYNFIPQLFFTHSFEDGPVSVGLGIYAPFGGSISWPGDTGFRTVATKGTTTYLRINPVVAVKLPGGFSLGVGLSANYAQMDLEQGLRPLAQPLENYFRFSGDGWAVGGNAGLLWQPCEYFSFGATFRSQTAFTLQGQTKFEQQPVISDTTLPAGADFEFPWNVTFGISIRPSAKWNIEFDADYTDWNSFNTVTIQQKGTPPFPLHQNIPVTLDWRASWMYELGVTRYFDGGWHASAGYVFDQNSVPDAFYNPLAADMNRHFFSLGIGRAGKRLDFDIAYQVGYGPPHTVTGSTPSSTPGAFAGQTADGTYHFFSQAVLVTVGLHF